MVGMGKGVWVQRVDLMKVAAIVPIATSEVAVRDDGRYLGFA